MPTIRSIGDATRTKNGTWSRIIDLGYRPNGKRWRVRVTAKTKNRLNDKVTAKIQELEHGVYRPGTTPTLAAWWTYWCDNIAAPTLRPNVLANYRSYGRKHIAHIGDNTLDKITPDHVRYLHRKMQDNGLSDSTIRAVHNTLGSALRAAVYEGIITTNAVDRVPKPKVHSNPREALSEAEVRSIIATCAGDGPRWESRWLTALLLGARQAECLGLEWSRVDLDQGLIDLSWQIQRIPWRHGKNCECGAGGTAARCPHREPDAPTGYEIRPCHLGKWFVRPKTQASIRMMPIPTRLWEALTAWREESGGVGLVWPNHAGNPLDAREDEKAWYELCERAGARRVVLHSARHTAVSMMLDRGVNPEVIRQVVGHSTVLSTRNYMHLSQDAARAALEWSPR